MAVLEQFRAHFGSDRRNLVASHSNCANIKKAHTLIIWYNEQKWKKPVDDPLAFLADSSVVVT